MPDIKTPGGTLIQKRYRAYIFWAFMAVYNLLGTIYGSSPVIRPLNLLCFLGIVCGFIGLFYWRWQHRKHNKGTIPHA